MTAASRVRTHPLLDERASQLIAAQIKLLHLGESSGCSPPAAHQGQGVRSGWQSNYSMLAVLCQDSQRLRRTTTGMHCRRAGAHPDGRVPLRPFSATLNSCKERMSEGQLSLQGPYAQRQQYS